jgi:peptidoglycan/xylan/chitin deacetylase (PgdA/CDA1 family)
MAPNDYAPTYCRVGDVVRTDAGFGFGERIDLVELPFDWSLDDWPYFTYDPGIHNEGLKSPNDVFDVWCGDFDYLHEEVGAGVFVLTMHPQCIGRGSRLRMLRRLVEHIQSRGGVEFCAMADVAARFRAAQPLAG